MFCNGTLTGILGCFPASMSFKWSKQLSVRLMIEKIADLLLREELISAYDFGQPL
jgi:hypothetical protein